MSMYDSLYSIQKSINQQALNNETQTMKKFKNENSLLLKLEDTIRKYKIKNKDIYNTDTRHNIIMEALTECFGNRITSNLRYTNPVDFVNNYETTENRIDIEYYYIYANKNYDKICKKIETDLQEDYKKIIAFEKLKIDREKLEHKKIIDYAKLNQTKKNYNIDYIHIFTTLLKVGFIVAMLPIIIVIAFIYGLICGLAKMK